MSFAPPKKNPLKKKFRRKWKPILKIDPSEQNVSVYVRVRPQLSNEEDHAKVIGVVDKKMLYILPYQAQQAMNGVKIQKLKKKYAFDHVFFDDSNQIKLFNRTTAPLINDLFKGLSSTVFAYGATGSGKTYTMIGDHENPGIMYSSISHLFREVLMRQNEKYIYNIKVSYFEIYNENIRDLLAPENNYTYNDLRENKQGEATIINLTECEVINIAQIWNVVMTGNLRRTCEPNSVHEHSSRSHACLQIKLNRRSKVRDIREKIQSAKLYMIDLAGSERAKRMRGIRLLEGANINRSLLALGNCINILARKSRHNRDVFVPYRNSKLTRILKESLSGNCKTVMISTVAPTSMSLLETVNTLKYANRAKMITTKQYQNVIVVDNEVCKMKGIIKELRNEVNELEMKLKDKNGTSFESKKNVNGNTLNMKMKIYSNSDKIFMDLKRKYQKILDSRMKLQVELMEIERIEIESKKCKNQYEIEVKEMEKKIKNENIKNVKDNENKESDSNIDGSVNEMKEHIKNIEEKLNELQSEIDVLMSKKDKLQLRMKLEEKNGDRLIRNMKNLTNYKEIISLLERNHLLEVENFALKYKTNHDVELAKKNDVIANLKFKLNMQVQKIKEFENVVKVQHKKDVEKLEKVGKYYDKSIRENISSKIIEGDTDEEPTLEVTYQLIKKKNNSKMLGIPKKKYVELPNIHKRRWGVDRFRKKFENMRNKRKGKFLKEISSLKPRNLNTSNTKRNSIISNIKLPKVSGVNGFSLLKQNFLKKKEVSRRKNKFLNIVSTNVKIKKKRTKLMKKRRKFKMNKRMMGKDNGGLLNIINKSYNLRKSSVPKSIINLNFGDF